MTNYYTTPARGDFPRLHIHTVIANYGIWAVLLRVLRAMLRAKRPPPSIVLSDHLRRDIGLPPLRAQARPNLHDRF
ncbi:hypothetical protein [Celeribacter neptunius]|uniref:Uncharacterized protein n=1 Tax=Celeribacter neptunius TaxID=588602 RepID=A0A1I3K1Z2_9RHOB|nr:hypothetical protein [Celeribacter neptunius]SFI66434.1 hypothetical protein SAMN04487991_0544 [Celeribacter neptunius]